jgi:septum formation topological specificity factor MinE
MRTTSRLARLLRAADRWTLHRFNPTTSGRPGRNERLMRPDDTAHTARRGAGRRRLERELADATPAERQDLLAVLRRYPAAEADDVREVLERQASRRTLVVGGLPHRP